MGKIFQTVMICMHSHHLAHKSFVLVAVLKFLKSKLALNSAKRMVLNFAKSFILLCLSQCHAITKGYQAVVEL